MPKSLLYSCRWLSCLCWTALMLSSVVGFSITRSPFTTITAIQTVIKAEATVDNMSWETCKETQHCDQSIKPNADLTLDRRNYIPDSLSSTPKPTAHSAPSTTHHPSSAEKAKVKSVKKVSKTKKDPIATTAASAFNGNSTSNNTSVISSDTKNEKEPSVNPRVVIITICAALGGLTGCFLCLLGTSEIAGCYCLRRLARGKSSPARVGLQSVSVSGKTISTPKPLSESSSDQRYQHQQQKQLTEFWNISDDKEPSGPKQLLKFKVRNLSRQAPAVLSRQAPAVLSRQAPAVLHITLPLDCIPPPPQRPMPIGSDYSTHQSCWSMETAYNNMQHSTQACTAKSKRMPAHAPMPLYKTNSSDILDTNNTSYELWSPRSIQNTSGLSSFPWDRSSRYDKEAFKAFAR